MTTDWVRCDVKVLLVVAWMTAGMPGVVLAQASAAVPNVAAAGEVHARGDIGGDWQGMLETNKSPRIVVKIARVDKGWSLKFYSIDQGAQLFNASRVAFDGSTLKFSINPIGGSYEGKLRADGSSIAGNWTQGPSPLPLTLVRATKETAWEIPVPPPPAKMMAADANPSFDVATIKPNDSGNPRMQGLSVNGRNFATHNSSLEDLIAFAYDVQTKQIIGGPDWMDKDRFDVAGVPDVEGLPNVNQLKIMLQKLLADRWKLTFHHDKKELSAFVLSAGKSGQKLPPTQSSGVWPTFGVGSVPGGATLIAQNATTTDFTIFLQLVVLDRPVVDRTGISGRYDMTFKFTPDDSLFNGHPPKAGSPTVGAETLPGFFEGVQGLGLRLEAEKTPVDVIVVDRAERYSAN